MSTASTPVQILLQQPVLQEQLTQGGHIRVIDNKGTIKYLTSYKMGLTQVTDSAPDGGIITTWQLGGQLAS